MIPVWCRGSTKPTFQVFVDQPLDYFVILLCGFSREPLIFLHHFKDYFIGLQMKYLIVEAGNIHSNTMRIVL